MTRNDWCSIANKKNPFPDKYVFCYFLSENENHINAAQELAKKRNCKLIRAVIRPKAVTHIKGVDDVYLSPSAFLSCIRDATVVLTDSFHGTLFSILFEKCFWTMERFSKEDPLNQNSRIYDVLEKLSITDRIIPFDSINVLLRAEEVNYELINKKLEIERQFSKNVFTE